MRRGWLIVAVTGLLAAPAVGLAVPLSSRISETERAIDGTRSQERVLVSTIEGFTSKITSLEGEIAPLQAREDAIASDLDAKLARLAEVQAELRTERARLVTLRARLVEGRRALARRLVDLYKNDNPDLLTVVMNADGFQHLVEDTEFARRVGRQDNRIIATVRDARAEAVRVEAHLGALAREQTATAAAVQQRRDAIAAVKGELVQRRDGLAAVRSEKSSALSSVQEDRHELEGDLSALKQQQAEIQAKLAGAGGGVLGQVRSGSGGLIWPVSGPIVSPFGQRWGRLHAGVDIAIPSGTPVRASAGGRVAIAGWVEGYGNYICIQHAGSLSTCYGHNTSLAMSVGQSVSQGQVISFSGCTGHCYGPHVHFETRIDGAPVDPMGYL